MAKARRAAAIAGAEDTMALGQPAPHSASSAPPPPHKLISPKCTYSL